MRTLVSTAREKDNIQKIFVNNSDGTYYGAIDLAELIVARSEDSLEELIQTAYPYVLDTDIIDDNIERVRGYDEGLIPVIREGDRAVVGVITSGDIAELVDERIGEDYARLAALGGEEENDERLIKSLGKRLPWLIILLFLGLLVSWVVGLYEGVVAEVPMIVAFQSLILGMAGNVGTQSLAVTVRALGGARKFGIKERLRMVLKEGRVALLGGALMGAISFGIVLGYLAIGGHMLPFCLTVGGCVGVAMCFAMTISGLTGVLIPLTLERLGVDPAVASGPLITTINDLVAVVSYYGLAGILLSMALI
jgi:magnesium transporter